jgi:putative ATP-binding cassette transporter
MATDIVDFVPAAQLSSPTRGWLDFLRQFFRLAGPYWNAEDKWRVRALTLLLIALTIGQVALAVALNRWTEALWDALEQRALERFLVLIGLLAAILAVNAGVVTFHLRVKRRIQIDWRTWLTGRVVNDWMTAGRHYQVSLTPGEHDNPDGRIAEDARIATEYAIDLGHSLFYCIVLLVSFTQILWVLSAGLHFSLGDLTIHVPGHMVWVALLYSLTGTTVAMLLGRPLVRAANSRQTGEANFRFGLVRGRENSLAVALLRGEAEERRRLLGLFGGAARAWDGQTTALSYIFLFTASWSVLSQVFPILVNAPHYIGGVITLGVLMQTAQAFQQMTAALAWPIDNLARVAEWRASVERVQGLHDALQRARMHREAPPAAHIEVTPSDAPVLTFENCSIATPAGETVLHAFTTRIAQGERVLVSGDATAIAALFKAVAGLWPWGGGIIRLPRDASPFFMPPRTYLPAGTLREALCYPSAEDAFDAAAIRRALLGVGLDHLASRLADTEVWDGALAIDEQQRLGFARLLLHRPDWIFIQEATDSLDTRGEEEMMRLLATEFPDATVVTAGRSAGLEAFHRRRLELRRMDGAAVLREVPVTPRLRF